MAGAARRARDAVAALAAGALTALISATAAGGSGQLALSGAGDSDSVHVWLYSQSLAASSGVAAWLGALAGQGTRRQISEATTQGCRA
jgi:hypothetical protein